MKYRVDILFDSDMDEETFAMWLEDTLYTVSNSRAAVSDVSMYQACDLPSFAEQMRRERERRVVGEEQQMSPIQPPFPSPSPDDVITIGPLDEGQTVPEGWIESRSEDGSRFAWRYQEIEQEERYWHTYSYPR